MSDPNRRLNWKGNTEDEGGVSYYVIDDVTDERVAGPFGSAPYAFDVRDRMKWPRDLFVDDRPRQEA